MPNPLTSPPSGHWSFPGLCHISQLKEHGWALGEGGSSGVTSARAADFLQQHVMNKLEPHQNLSGCYLGWISFNGIKFRDNHLGSSFLCLVFSMFLCSRRWPWWLTQKYQSITEVIAQGEVFTIFFCGERSDEFPLTAPKGSVEKLEAKGSSVSRESLRNSAVKIPWDNKAVFLYQGSCPTVTQTFALWQAELWGKMSIGK